MAPVALRRAAVAGVRLAVQPVGGSPSSRTTRAPCAAATTAVASVEASSTTITSVSRPGLRPSEASSGASVVASLRAGMTTLTSSDRPGAVEGLGGRHIGRAIAAPPAIEPPAAINAAISERLAEPIRSSGCIALADRGELAPRRHPRPAERTRRSRRLRCDRGSGRTGRRAARTHRAEPRRAAWAIPASADR